MADEPDTANPDTAAEPNATPEPATPAPQTVTLTVEEFEAKLNERAAQTRRAIEAAQGKKPTEPKPKKGEDPGPALSPDEIQSMMRRQSAFDRAVGKANLSDDQVSILETLFSVEKPQDVTEWVSRKAKAFGTATPNPNNNAKPTTVSAAAAAQLTAPPTPSTPPPAHPAPATTNPAAPPPSVLNWDGDQMRAYLRAKGANPANPYSKEYRAVARELRMRAEAEGSTVKVVGPK